MKKKLIYLALPIMLGSLSIASCSGGNNNVNNNTQISEKYSYNLEIDAPSALKEKLGVDSPKDGVYDKGTTIKVSINFTETTAYSFDGYFLNEKKVSDKLTYSFVLNDNSNLVAKFSSIDNTAEENPIEPVVEKFSFKYEIDAPESFKDSISIKSSKENGEYEFGTLITVSLKYSENKKLLFDGIFINDSYVSSKQIYTFVLTENTILKAKFTQKPDQSNRITFWHPFDQGIENTVQHKIAEFEEMYEEANNVDIQINFVYQGDYNILQDKVVKGFVVGNTPTIAVAYPDNVADYLSLETDTTKFVYNLEPFFNDPEIGFDKQEEFNPSLKGTDDFVPSFLDEGQHYIKEGTYSLPLMKSSEVLLYNSTILELVLRDYLKEEIVNVDEYMNSISWDEFINLLRFTSINLDKYGDGLITPMVFDSEANLYIEQSFQRDIPYISMENGVGSVAFNNSEAKAMVQELKAYYDEGLFLTKGTNNTYYSGETLRKEECIFMVCSTEKFGYFDYDFTGGFETGIAKVPNVAKDEDHTKYASQGVTLTILKNSMLTNEENDARARIAWQLIKYLTSEDVNIDICLSSSGSYAPVRESCYTNELYTSYLEESDFLPRCAKVVSEEINGDYFNYPVFKGTAIAREQVGEIITQVFLGEKDIDQAFLDAESATKIAMQ